MEEGSCKEPAGGRTLGRLHAPAYTLPMRSLEFAEITRWNSDSEALRNAEPVRNKGTLWRGYGLKT